MIKLGKDGFNPYLMKRTIVGLDYDGVLVDDNMNYVQGALDLIKELNKFDIDIIIWSCRNDEYIKNVVEELRVKGYRIYGGNVAHGVILEHYGGGCKIFCHKYVDDQAVGFSKLSWKDISDEIVGYHKKRMQIVGGV